MCNRCSKGSRLMCESLPQSADVPGSAKAAWVPDDLDAFTGERIPLAAVERVSITSLVDNVCDALAADIGPAHRPTGERLPTVCAPLMEHGSTIDVPRAEHGFSALVEV